VKTIRLGLLMTGVFLAGYFFPRRVYDDFSPPAADSSEVRRLREKVTQLEGQLAEIRSEKSAKQASASQIPAVVTGQTGDLQVLAKLTKDKVAKFQVPVLTQAGTIAKQLIELFNLNPAEIEALQGIATTTRTRLAQHASETAMLARADASSVAIVVPPSAQAGEIYDGLMTGIQNILGVDRYTAFLTLEGDALSKAFGGFGAYQQNITVRMNLSADGSTSLLIVNGYIGPDGSESKSGVNVRNQMPLPGDLAWLTRFQSNFAELQPAFKAGSPIPSVTFEKPPEH
jgi:hypothetical protein